MKHVFCTLRIGMAIAVSIFFSSAPLFAAGGTGSTGQGTSTSATTQSTTSIPSGKSVISVFYDGLSQPALTVMSGTEVIFRNESNTMKSGAPAKDPKASAKTMQILFTETGNNGRPIGMYRPVSGRTEYSRTFTAAGTYTYTNVSTKEKGSIYVMDRPLLTVNASSINPEISTADNDFNRAGIFTLMNGSAKDVSIKQLKLKLSGMINDSAIIGITAFSDNLLLSRSTVFSNKTTTITFSSPLLIQKSSLKKIEFYVTLAKNLDGQTYQLSIASADDIQTSVPVNFSNTFPIKDRMRSIANVGAPFSVQTPDGRYYNGTQEVSTQSTIDVEVGTSVLLKWQFPPANYCKSQAYLVSSGNSQDKKEMKKDEKKDQGLQYGSIDSGSLWNSGSKKLASDGTMNVVITRPTRFVVSCFKKFGSNEYAAGERNLLVGIREPSRIVDPKPSIDNLRVDVGNQEPGYAQIISFEIQKSTSLQISGDSVCTARGGVMSEVFGKSDFIRYTYTYKPTQRSVCVITATSTKTKESAKKILTLYVGPVMELHPPAGYAVKGAPQVMTVETNNVSIQVSGSECPRYTSTMQKLTDMPGLLARYTYTFYPQKTTYCKITATKFPKMTKLEYTFDLRVK